MLSKKSKINLIANQTKYGWIKVTNLKIDQRNHGQKKLLQEYIQHKMNKNIY